MIFLDIAIVTAWLAVLAVVGLHLGRLSIWPFRAEAITCETVEEAKARAAEVAAEYLNGLPPRIEPSAQEKSVLTFQAADACVSQGVNHTNMQ
jgi:hypothetical protein